MGARLITPSVKPKTHGGSTYGFGIVMGRAGGVAKQPIPLTRLFSMGGWGPSTYGFGHVMAVAKHNACNLTRKRPLDLRPIPSEAARRDASF